MSVRDFQPKTISNLRCPWTLTDQILQGSPARGFLGQNIRVAPGRLYSREGTSRRLATAGQITGMYNWLTVLSTGQPVNLVLYLENLTALRSLNLAGTTPNDLVTGILNTRGISVAEAGPRAMVSFFNTKAQGSFQCRVTDGVSIADKAFQGPIAGMSINATDGGTGRCTAGQHKIGFIFQSRTGFSGRFSPALGTNFAPGSVTLLAGNRSINLSITLDTPPEAGIGSAIYVIMTRADNPNRFFFVPGAFAILPPGAAGWTQFFLPISITDEDLADSAEDATDFNSRLTQDASGNGPFAPSVVFPYRHRTVYIVNQKAYVSEINDAQAITEDQNVIQTPGQKRTITGFAQGTTLYLLGEKWTASTNDNGDLPATWSQPEEIAQIGTTAPNGIEARTAGGYAWIASEHGLWLFQGRYDPYHPDQPKPITYLCADWKRINWNAAYAIQVVDDITNLRCYVAAPLDAATEPSHLFTVDYTNGLTYDTCDISLDSFNAKTFSSICLTKEAATSKSVLWIGPSAAGQILVQDPATHNDDGAPIHALWESGYIRTPEDEIPSRLFRVGACHFRVRGEGGLYHTWYGVDRAVSVAPEPLALDPEPGQELFARFDLAHVENATVRIETNGVDAWFECFGLVPYLKKDLFLR